MRNRLIILIAIFSIMSCRQQQNSENTAQIEIISKNDQSEFQNIIHKKYSHISDMEALYGYQPTRGTVIDVYTEEEYRYGFQEVIKENEILLLYTEIKTNDFYEKEYEILDALRLTNIKKTQFLSFAYCSKDGKFDGQIAVLVDTINNAHPANFEQIVKAWNANESLEKFEEISIEGITCENSDFSAIQ